MPEHDTLETLLLEERNALQLPAFDFDAAWELGSRIRALAVEKAAPVAIEIVHGNAPVFFTLLPGASPDNRDWVARKRNVVARFLHSSLYMRLFCEGDDVDLNTRYRLDPEHYVASGGGVPIFVQGTGLVGVAAVSGLPDVEDHRLVVTALTSLRSSRQV